ncbi:hypothetical protein ILUMI_03834 [Ignelater luminosus]|uniref:Uncharacterized protein n=1 Tax=Ignelater luminosus TaxID=2038154 RepID=A0A8K0DF21_IGNLU|nr:hypothetical protein ILUMI_03834 [Ignelater luminosus]
MRKILLKEGGLLYVWVPLYAKVIGKQLHNSVAGWQGSIDFPYAYHALDSLATTACNHSLTTTTKKLMHLLERVAEEIEAISVENVANEDEANEEVMFADEIFFKEIENQLMFKLTGVMRV